MATDISTIIAALNRVGAENVSTLSRITGIPQETVRYVMRRRFPEIGLSIRTSLNYAMLGLEQYAAIFRLSQETYEKRAGFFQNLANAGFLTYRSEFSLEPLQYAMFTVPVTVSEEFRHFLNDLRDAEVISGVTLERLDWSRLAEMKTEYFDFREKNWKVDWNKVNSATANLPELPDVLEPPAVPDTDKADLLILKELQADSWRNMAEIARKLKINDRTLRWHYSKHAKPAIKAYYVHWIPSEFSRSVGLLCEFKGLSRAQVAAARELFGVFPFTLYEAGSNAGGYYQAEAGVPADQFVRATNFIRAGFQRLGITGSVRALDLSTSWAYTIPYQNFSDENGWTFDREGAVESIISTLKTR